MNKHTFLFLAAAILAGAILAGCKDNISSLGAQYYTDTVGIHTTVRNDTGFFHFADTLRPFVSFNGTDAALTDSTPVMIIGRVAIGNENLESWGLLQFPSLTDSVANMVTGVELLLKNVQYKYGDTTNDNVSFRVWTSYQKVYDSTTSISQSDLSAAAVGSIDTAFSDDSDNVLPIAFDVSLVKPVLTEAFNAFVITPGMTMTNARRFGTLHNWPADTNSIPRLILILNNGDTIDQYPTLDFHLVHDMSATPSGEFTLQGSTGKRERVSLNLTRPTDSAHLDQFTSINNATLVLHLDPSNSRFSNNPLDSIAPAVVYLGTVDSADHYDNTDPPGYRDPSDPTGTTYRFQIRYLLESWLRDPTQNLGLELRTDFAQRTFGGGGAQPQLIGVEDNTLDRWTFYGPGASDSTKRPSFILSYSKLH